MLKIPLVVLSIRCLRRAPPGLLFSHLVYNLSPEFFDMVLELQSSCPKKCWIAPLAVKYTDPSRRPEVVSLCVRSIIFYPAFYVDSNFPNAHGHNRASTQGQLLRMEPRDHSASLFGAPGSSFVSLGLPRLLTRTP